MILHQDWMTNNTIFGDNYAKDLQTQEAKDRFDIQRYQSNEGFLVKVDGIDEQVAIQIHVSPLSEDREQVKIVCNLECNLNTGYIVLHEGKTFIVVSKINENSAYKYANMHESNNTLKFYSSIPPSSPNPITNEPYQIPCIVGKGNINLSVDKFISLASDEYIVSCPNTVDSLKIGIGTRFILSGSAYVVMGVDVISNVGLLYIKIKEDQIVADDNRELGIANWYSHQSIQEIYILNGGFATLLYTNATLQLNIQCKENGVIVDNSRVTYTSDHLNVATVSTNGLITAIGTGDSIVTATFGTTSVSISIHSDMTVSNNYSILITPSDITLKISRSLIFTSHFLNNGVEVFNQNCTWSLTNSDGTNNVYATIAINGFSCTVTATSNTSYVGKYVKLRSTLVSDDTKYIEKEIKIVGLF